MTADASPLVSVDSLQVGLGKIKILGAGVFVFFTIFSGFAYLDHAFWASLGIFALSLLGLFLMVYPGRYLFDENGVTYCNIRGTYRFHWDELETIYFGTGGTLALCSNKKRFLIMPIEYWTGNKKILARDFLSEMIKSSKITPNFDKRVDYLINKNCRVG